MSGVAIFATFMAITIAAMVILPIAYDWIWGYRRIVRRRISAIDRRTPQAKAGELFSGSIDDQKQRLFSRLVESLRNSIDLAIPNLSFAKFIQVTLVMGIIGGCVGYIASREVLVIPVGCAVGLISPILFLWYLVRQKVKKLTKQLPAAFDVLRGSVQAGHSVQTALQVIADEFEAPISTEFGRCVSHAKLGVSPETVYRELASRFPVKEMRILMVGLVIQNRSGGNLSGLLSALSETVRARIRLKGKLKTLTSEGRIQAKAMTLLPALALAIMQVTSAEYVAPLWRNSYLLVFAFVLQFIGAVWIHRIVNSCNFQSKGA